MKFLKQLKYSVTDIGFYKGIKDNKIGKTFSYFLLFFLILYIINSVQNYVIIQNVVDYMSYELVEQLPEFKIVQGELEFNGPMPFYLVNEGESVIVVDTTNNISIDKFENHSSVIFVAKDKIYIKNFIQQQQIGLANMPEGFGKSDLINMVSKINIIAIAVMVFGFIFVVGYKLLNAVILALIGLLFSSIYKVDFKFRQVFNIAVYALTLPLLLQLAHDLSKLGVTGFGLIYWAISIVYVALAVKQFKNNNTRESTNDDVMELDEMK